MPRRWLALAAALWALAACAAPNPITRLSADSPIVQIAAGLTLSVNPANLPDGFGARLNAFSAADFAADPAWQAAQAALPANLRLAGSIFTIATAGPAPSSLFLSVLAPNAADPARLDLYAWDGQTWAFLPAERNGRQWVAEVTRAPAALAAFEPVARPPLTLVALEPGQALTPAALEAGNGLVLGGVAPRADGSLTGQLPNLTDRPSQSLYPRVLAPANDAAVSAILGDVNLRAQHAQTLAGLAAGYDGLVLDYRGLTASQGPAFTDLARQAADAIHGQNRQLFIAVEVPALGADGRFDSAGYDWRALAAAADGLLIHPPAAPGAYGDGQLDGLLTWAIGQASRGRLLLDVPTLSVEARGSDYAWLAPADVLQPLGAASVLTSAQNAPGQPITLTLSGQADSLNYDAAAFAARYTYASEAGARTVWLVTANTVRQRLTLAEKYHLGGALVTGLFVPGQSAALANAVTAYKVNQAAAAAGVPSLLWSVSNAQGALSQATAQPGQAYIYIPAEPGDYQFAASLQNDANLPLGSASVRVAAITSTPTPRPSGSAGGSTGGSGGTPAPSGNPGGFVPPPPIAAGNFGLGGQVPGYIGHLDLMRQAGMSWVKYQANDPAAQIAAGKAAGFKVLMSVVGDRSRAADPNYWPEFARYVAGIAALGADAIEVWNEPNLDREWPNGQISGQAYTEMLKQAYAAIKAANPGTMVISAAPSPTGAAGSAGCVAAFCNDDVFLSQMAAAGAANYMDCAGVHFNSGTTSPNATTGSVLSGYHYSYYFWPMVDLYYNAFGGSRPLCFTEVGYLSPQGYESLPLPAYFQWAAGITVAQQAQWLAETASLSASSGKVRMMMVFNVDFTVYLSNDPQAGYAILRPDGSCPACATLDAVMP